MSFFNGADVDDSVFDAIPPGQYMVTVEYALVKTTKSGSGRYIAVCFEIISDKQTGRKIFQNFNIENQSEKAQQLGKAELKRFLAALGITVLESEADVERLEGQMLMVDVVNKKDRSTGQMRESISRYLKRDGTDPMNSAVPHGSTAGMPAPAAARAPETTAPTLSTGDDVPF